MDCAALDCPTSCSEVLQSPPPSHDVWDGLLIAAMGTVGSSQAQADGKSESCEMHSNGGSTSQSTRRENMCGNEWASPKVKAKRKWRLANGIGRAEFNKEEAEPDWDNVHDAALHSTT